MSDWHSVKTYYENSGLSIKKDIIPWFEQTKFKKLKVNEKEYENKVGTPTPSGWYSNGFTAKIIDGKKGRREYLAIHIYTAVKNKVDIEEKYLFAKINDTYKLCKHLGWDNWDMRPVSKDYMDDYGMLIAIYKKYH